MNSIVNIMYVGSQIRVPLVVSHSDDSDMVEDWILSEGTIIGIDTEHEHVAIMFNMSSCAPAELWICPMYRPPSVYYCGCVCRCRIVCQPKEGQPGT